MSAKAVSSLSEFVSPTILVVEDEVLTRVMLADELRDQGYTVVEAANGDEALAILHSQTGIDVLVTDQRMPGAVDGATLGRLVHCKYPDISVVMVSGERPGPDLQGVLDGYFSKPCDPTRLAAHLQTLTTRDPSSPRRKQL